MTKIAIALIFGLSSWLAMGQIPDCRTDALEPGDALLLEQYHILMTKRGLLLDPRLVPDCVTRESIASVIQHNLVGKLGLIDETFALKHKGDFNVVILAVWPAIANSPAFPSDGATADEKWSILEDPAVETHTLDELVSSYIRQYGLSPEASFLLFTRSTPALYQTVSDTVKSSRSSVSEKLFGIALLSRRDPNLASAEIKKLSMKDLSQVERGVADRIRSRLSLHKPVQWADVRRLADPT
jgi:hypothetical protein